LTKLLQESSCRYKTLPVIDTMKRIELSSSTEAYIWAPRVLAGAQLEEQTAALLTIKGGLIASVAHVPRGELPGRITSHPGFYPLAEGTILLPALIDAHVHLSLDGESGQERSRPDESGEALLPRVRRHWEAYDACGIGAVRDGGDRAMAGLRLRRLLAEEGASGPWIVAAGQAIYKQGGYGSFLGPGCSSMEEIFASLQRLAAAGVDQGKILLSGIVSFEEYGRVERSRWTLEELKAVVREGHRLGLRMMAHASSAEAVELALRAGVDSIEHGYFITGEQLREMGARRIAWIPTIIPVAVQARNPLSRCRPGRRAIISRIYREQMQKLSLALQEGVPLGVGTDAGAPGVRHGESLLEEMLLYRRAGLTNRAILQAATATNASILGLDRHGMGTLKTGRKPRLIGVAGNPLAALEALKKVDYYFY